MTTSCSRVLGWPMPSERVSLTHGPECGEALQCSCNCPCVRWRVDEERRAGSVAAARQEITRLEHAAIEAETAAVNAG